jgi:hypothetical protein
MQLKSLSFRGHLAKLGGTALTFEFIAMGIGLVDNVKVDGPFSCDSRYRYAPERYAWRGLMKQVSPGTKV